MRAQPSRDTNLMPSATLSVRGTTVRMRQQSRWERWRGETFEEKEPDLLDWINDVSGAPGAVLFDIGANIGQYCVFAAKRFPECHVVAFEPSPHNLASLCDNIALNALTNITVCAAPISSVGCSRTVSHE